jgi:FAD/FMN-containing dehydrogenase
MTVALIAELTQCVGPAHVLTDPDLTIGYRTDWTGRWTGAATACVVRPANECELARVVMICAAHNAVIVTQGGNTGLVGGSVPHDHSGVGDHRARVLLSTGRLVDLSPVDAAASQVTAGAGVTIADLHRHARASGLDVGVDWGARDSATVGGAVATNAGGSRVVRFGTMRSQVVGVRAVLVGGQIVGSLDGLAKETVGPDLGSMLCGSEGTLAIITAARLRLVPWYQHRSAAWIGLRSVADACELLRRLRGPAGLDGLDAVEVLFDDAVEVTCNYSDSRPPRYAHANVYLLIDVARHDDPTGELAEFLTRHGADVGAEGVVAVGAQRTELLGFRDRITSAINAVGVPLKLDVALPLDLLPRFVDELFNEVEQQAGESRCVVFGHLAEGNLHVNILGAGDRSPDLATWVLGRAIELGGTFSAEHGVGVAKSHWLARRRGAAETDLLWRLKRSFDPDNRLNPGVLLPDT